MTERGRRRDEKSLLSARAALIFLVSLLIGGAMTTLSLLASGSWPAAVLAGATAFGAAVPTLNKVID